jgi:hypothetical protein
MPDTQLDATSARRLRLRLARKAHDQGYTLERAGRFPQTVYGLTDRFTGERVVGNVAEGGGLTLDEVQAWLGSLRDEVPWRRTEKAWKRDMASLIGIEHDDL